VDISTDTENLSHSERLLILRYEVLRQLRKDAVVPPSMIGSIAACLNLITDVDKLTELNEKLHQGVVGKDLLWAVCECLDREEAPTLPDLPSSEEMSRLEVLQNVPIVDEPCELKRRLRQALLLINEGCVLLLPMSKDELLLRAAKVACKLTSGTAAMAVVLENEHKSRVGVCGTMQKLDSFPTRAHHLLDPAFTGEPLLIEDVDEFPDRDYMPPWHVPVKSAISVPLGTTGKPVGVILVGYAEKREIDAGDVDMLKAFSRQVSFALRNLTLQNQARELERLQERQRIAQDLHDTVIQLLFVMGMEAESLMRCCSDRPEVFDSISKIRKLASRAATELRSAIDAMSLKSTTGKASMFELLQEVVEEWEKLSGIHVTLVSPSRWPEISSEAQRAIYRIVREALVNVQKHAQATEAIVSVTYMADRLVVSVQDNGRGFPKGLNLLEPGPLHFGMKNMHGLAGQVGGYIEALNGDDGGAVVRFVLPLDT